MMQNTRRPPNLTFFVLKKLNLENISGEGEHIFWPKILI